MWLMLLIHFERPKFYILLNLFRVKDVQVWHIVVYFENNVATFKFRFEYMYFSKTTRIIRSTSSSTTKFTGIPSIFEMQQVRSIKLINFYFLSLLFVDFASLCPVHCYRRFVYLSVGGAAITWQGKSRALLEFVWKQRSADLLLLPLASLVLTIFLPRGIHFVAGWFLWPITAR